MLFMCIKCVILSTTLDFPFIIDVQFHSLSFFFNIISKLFTFQVFYLKPIAVTWWFKVGPIEPGSSEF